MRPAHPNLARLGAQDIDYGLAITAIKADAELDKLALDHPARELRSIWGEIGLLNTQEGDFMVYNNHLIPPKAARAAALVQLHSTHQCLVKIRMAAQSSYFWPGISNHLKTTVEACVRSSSPRKSWKP